MADLSARPLTDAEWEQHATFVAHAFLDDPDPRAVPSRELFPDGRLTGIHDGTRLVGAGGIQTRELTVPGPLPAPVAAVTSVAVRPDARGRGALSALMRAQFDELHDTGAEPVAVLWASQAPIYGRFGYGLASRSGGLTVPGQAPFRPGTVRGGEIRWLDETQAAPLMREVHARAAAGRVGWLSRTRPNWRWWLFDDASGGSWCAQRYALHHGPDGAPDGYAAFRVRTRWEATGANHQLSIKELVAATPEGHAELWRSLLDLDLVGSVVRWPAPLDDPVLSLLVNPRGVLGNVRDGMWVRLVELDRALLARRYAATCELVLEVTDPQCGWNTGRWRLRVSADGVAQIDRTTAPADLTCDIGDLGAAYLGGTRLTTLAAAGRVREHREGAVRSASRAFAGDDEPFCPEIF